MHLSTDSLIEPRDTSREPERKEKKRKNNISRVAGDLTSGSLGIGIGVTASGDGG
jgi:hypothetical protein